MERPTVVAVTEVHIRLPCLFSGTVLEDRHRTEQDRVVPLHPVEIDLRQLDRRDAAVANKRGEAVDREEGDVGLVRGHGAPPRLDLDGRAFERAAPVLAPELLHERAGSTGVSLELECRRLPVAERHEGHLLPFLAGHRYRAPWLPREKRGRRDRAGRGHGCGRLQEVASLEATQLLEHTRSVFVLQAHREFLPWWSGRSGCWCDAIPASAPGDSTGPPGRRDPHGVRRPLRDRSVAISG